VTSNYDDQLTTYLASQRWFAGKGRKFSVSHVHPLPWLSETDPRVRVEVVTVLFADGQEDAYQFPTAYLKVPDPEMVHALVGEFEHPEMGRVSAYDAVYFTAASELLLDGFRTGQHGDELSFEVVDSAELPTQDVTGTVMTAEQSNTSIAYGEQAILKLFRRISDGGNPDIEIHAALTRNGGDHVAPLLGWIEGRWSNSTGETRQGHLGILQVFLRGATDGWALALSSVRTCLAEEDPHLHEAGADFAVEAERLGQATAEVHADLAKLFATATHGRDHQRDLAAAMRLRLDAAVAIVPELEDYDLALRARFAELAELSSPITVQRIHGDLHLGQTLRTVDGWKIIDFEGEPSKSLAERVAPDSPMRDVAGMLRSFDYAAGVTLQEFGTGDHLRYRADEWSQRNRDAFLHGYANRRGVDVVDHTVLLRAYETDKAIYEAVYEARNRPGWLAIPLREIARLVAKE
jgi:maltokinase